jgi:RNA polymerase subunit RPABC4/transcription elongation factor Spt4
MEGQGNYMSETFSDKMRRIRFRRKRERLRFTEELKLIPRWLIFLCVVLYFVALCIAIAVNINNPPAERFAPEWNDLSKQTLALAGLVTLVSVVLSCYLFMLGYVYRDAKRRDMHPALWTLAVFILNQGSGVLGLIIYLLLREPLPYPCPSCANLVSAQYNFCPHCKYNLHPACPQCGREVSDADKFCPFCATELTHAPAPIPAPGAVPQIPPSPIG